MKSAPPNTVAAPNMTRREVLAALDAGQVVSLTWVTWDAKRPDNSGEVRHLDEGQLAVHAWKRYRSENGDAERARTVVEAAQIDPAVLKTAKPVDRDAHFIRDIQPLSGGIPVGHLVRLHPRLIFWCNGRRVS